MRPASYRLTRAARSSCRRLGITSHHRLPHSSRLATAASRLRLWLRLRRYFGDVWQSDPRARTICAPLPANNCILSEVETADAPSRDAVTSERLPLARSVIHSCIGPALLDL